MPSSMQDPYNIESLFEQMAAAVINTQTRLDLELGPNYLMACQTEAHRLIYSIHRVTVDLEFGLESKKRKKLLGLIPAGKQNERHTHHLRFSLLAVPEAPPMPAADADERVTFSVLEPHFLLSPEQERRVYDRLIGALESADWRFAFPNGADEPHSDKARVEAKKIRQSLVKPEADRGMVAFQIDTSPASYLVVRVTGKGSKDGVFVLTPGQSPDVTIYSFEGDGVEHVLYQPLHEIILTVRRWLAGAEPSRLDYPEGVPSETALGLRNLELFAQMLANGYAAGLRLLSRNRDDSAFPAHYDLSDVNAELAFSVQYGEPKQPQIDFIRRMAPDGRPPSSDEGHELVESRALINVRRAGSGLRVEATLQAPEFVLAGVARTGFLRIINSRDDGDTARENAETIANAFARGDERIARIYLDFLHALYYPGVVVLLSYEGNRPKGEFLVIWPAPYSEKSGDFVFSCERKGDKIQNVAAVMSLEDTPVGVRVRAAVGNEAKTDLSERQYEAFHNFFHAVRIWRSRVSPKDGR